MSASICADACKHFLQWRYGDKPVQVVFGKAFIGAQVEQQDLDALLERVGDQPFFFHVGELNDDWSDPASHESGRVTSASNKHVPNISRSMWTLQSS